MGREVMLAAANPQHAAAFFERHQLAPLDHNTSTSRGCKRMREEEDMGSQQMIAVKRAAQHTAKAARPKAQPLSARQRILRKRRREPDADQDATRLHDLVRKTSRLRLESPAKPAMIQLVQRDDSLVRLELQAGVEYRLFQQLPIHIAEAPLLMAPGQGVMVPYNSSSTGDERTAMVETHPVIAAPWKHPGPFEAAAAASVQKDLAAPQENDVDEEGFFQDSDGMLCFITPGARSLMEEERKMHEAGYQADMDVEGEVQCG